jgi:hypothetical protein
MKSKTIYVSSAAFQKTTMMSLIYKIDFFNQIVPEYEKTPLKRVLSSHQFCRVFVILANTPANAKEIKVEKLHLECCSFRSVASQL